MFCCSTVARLFAYFIRLWKSGRSCSRRRVTISARFCMCREITVPPVSVLLLTVASPVLSRYIEIRTTVHMVFSMCFTFEVRDHAVSKNKLPVTYKLLRSKNKLPDCFPNFTPAGHTQLVARVHSKH